MLYIYIQKDVRYERGYLLAVDKKNAMKIFTMV